MTAFPLTALQQQREDAALGAAWRRCEAALPEGDWFDVSRYAPNRVRAVAYLDAPEVGVLNGEGPTPTAALNALADKLETLPLEPPR